MFLKQNIFLPIFIIFQNNVLSISPQNLSQKSLAFSKFCYFGPLYLVDSKINLTSIY